MNIAPFVRLAILPVAIVSLAAVLTFVCCRLGTAAEPGTPAAEPEVIPVANDAELRAGLRNLSPGKTLRIAPGEYQPPVYVENLHGEDGSPVIIEGADAEDPPRFVGGAEGWHFTDVSYLVVRNLHVSGQRGNGINVDDGGSCDTPSHHLLLEDIRVSDIGPSGNHDGIKLSGVDDFVIRRCRVEGWGGQAIDMVGCHRGRIEECAFRGKEGFSQHTGPQAKGGSSEVLIRRCLFLDAGMRAVQMGGSTGLDFFRPPGRTFEAADIQVDHCVFVGGQAAVTFVGVDGGIFRHNTIYRPTRWVMRILQETREPEFVRTRNGLFERNLIVFRRSELADFVNVGPDTLPQTFQFRANWWYCEDAPQVSRPRLPTSEMAGVYGHDPRLADPEELDFRPENPRAKTYGAAQPESLPKW